MVDYLEKRDFQRMVLDCSLTYRRNDDDSSYQGQVRDLSARGVSFLTDDSLPLGIDIQITLTPENDITPPLHASVRITRCDKHGDGRYHVAGEILQID
jgi:hypothetical protein